MLYKRAILVAQWVGQGTGKQEVGGSKLAWTRFLKKFTNRLLIKQQSKAGPWNTDRVGGLINSFWIAI